jgi:hypothetical protein
MGNQESATLQTYEAGSDLTGNQFRFVSIASDGQVDQTGAGLMAAGVQQDNMANVAGLPVQVQTYGRTKVVAGAGTENAGDLLASDATGRAVLATTGDIVLGVCRSDAGAADEIIDMDFFHGHVTP